MEVLIVENNGDLCAYDSIQEITTYEKAHGLFLKQAGNERNIRFDLRDIDNIRINQSYDHCLAVCLNNTIRCRKERKEREEEIKAWQEAE